MQIASFFEEGGNGKGPPDRLPLGVDQKLLNWLTHMGEIETAVRSDIKCRFGIIGF